MEKPVFKDIAEQLENFAVEFFELLDEIDAHKEVTLLRLHTLYNDRVKVIEEESRREMGSDEHASEPTVVEH